MASASGSLDYWRKFFRSTNSDIIEVIECAILVATSDCPKELRKRRDQITEKLYASHCFGCDRAELRTPEGGSVQRGEKESKAGSSSDIAEELNPALSNYSYNDAEALTDEIEEESQIVEEVLRIKEILANNQDESDNHLFESLRRLQLMALSVETLKATDIGRAVNGLRRHNSKEIRHLVRTLVEGWKVLVDEWISATATITTTDNSPASVSAADLDQEEGLPSPPLDEGALWATQTTSIQLSEFFDGMDEEGNFRTNVESNEKQERRRYAENLGPVRKPPISENNEHTRAEPAVRQAKPQGKDKGEARREELVIRQTKPQGIDNRETRRQEPVVAHRPAMPQAISNKPSSNQALVESGPGRPPKLPLEKKGTGETNAGIQKKPTTSPQDGIRQSKHNIIDSGARRPVKLSTEMKGSGELNAGYQKKPPASLLDKSTNSEEASLRLRLEAAKRKLHENYQQAENAKKQRTIQVMEIHDIPKRATINRHPVQKPKSNFRNLMNGRR